MIIIEKYLNLKLLKNDNLNILQNNVAYSKKFDKILFEIEGSKYSFILNDNFEFIKEDADTVFYLSNKECYVKLKKENISFDINIEKININKANNTHTINYKLESDEEETTLEIEFL